MIGIFVSLDLFLYYGFWELSLVPMALLIATFGRTENRRRAAIKFFLYTFIPSALLLVAMIWLYSQTGTFDLPDAAGARRAACHLHQCAQRSALLRLRFLFAFGVKVPIFPLHGWLSEAVRRLRPRPSWCSLASLASTPFCASASPSSPSSRVSSLRLLIALGAIGIVYGALLALVQSDLKKLAAFATLSANSFIVLGIFTFTISGLDGGTYQILNEVTDRRCTIHSSGLAL